MNRIRQELAIFAALLISTNTSSHGETWKALEKRVLVERKAAAIEMNRVMQAAAQGVGVENKIQILGEQIKTAQITNQPLNPVGVAGFGDRELSTQGIYADPDYRNNTAQAMEGGAWGRVWGDGALATGMFTECVAVGRGDRYYASGIVIQNDLIITAAHICENNPGSIPNKIWVGNVAPGTRNANNTGFITPEGVELKVIRYWRHENYLGGYKTPKGNDLMLLEVAPEDRMNILERGTLASMEESHLMNSVRIAGYGNDRIISGTPFGFGIRREASIPGGVSWSPAFGLFRLQTGESTRILEFATASKIESADTCDGDSGGPVYITSGGDYRIVGVTSRRVPGPGARCGPGGVYTYVPAYKEWIASSYTNVSQWKKVQ